MANHIIRSRFGNVALAVVGAIYLVCALGTLSFYVITSWGAAALTDHLLQLMLVGSALAGGFFLITAVGNLGVGLRTRRHQS